MESLALRYRPKTWEDVIGQETSVRILMAMLERGKIYPFFIFGGPRAVGKTTVSRILAKAVNCPNRVNFSPCNACEICLAIDDESCPDVMELDAASNGGVASVRKIRELSMYSPIMVEYRVIILDEAHAMSREAMQAMLKVLEEPPPRTIFIMATTETQMIPDTILSRAFPFEFKRIPPSALVTRLRQIADIENLDISNQALQAISLNVSGGVRDAITLLQQLTSMQERVEEQHVIDLLGALKRQEVSAAIDSIIDRRAARIVMWIGELKQRGISPFVVLEALLGYVNDLLAASVGVGSDLDKADQERVFAQSQKLGVDALDQLAESITVISVRASRAPRLAQLFVETGLIRIALGKA